MDGVAWEPDERDMNKRRRATLQAASRRGGSPGTRTTPRGSSSLVLSGVRRAALIGAGVAALTLSTEVASAQEWLKDRQFAEGPGVRVGDFELHPGIGVQGGYDSNWFLRTDKSGDVNSGVQGVPEMLVTPSISLSTMGMQRKEGEANGEGPSVTFRATASGTYREYFGQITPEQRNGSVDAAISLGILPGRPWGANLGATYDRVIQPTSLTSANPDFAYNRDLVGATAEIVSQPGSGTLDWHLGGSLTGTLFEQSGGQAYNNFVYSVFTRGRWKFRPKTALIVDATLGFQNFSPPAGAVTPVTTPYNSDPVRTHFGLNGLLTPRLSLLATVGYGGTFLSPATPNDPHVQQYDSVIGQAELKVFLTAPPGEGAGLSLSQSSLAFGYTRDFQTSYLTEFNGIDRGYLKFSYFFAGRALISLEGGGAAIEYPEFFLASAPKTAQAAFTDARLDATLFSEYRFTNSFGLNGTFRYTTELSSTTLNLAASPTSPVQNYAMEWQRWEAYLGVRLFL